MLPRRSSSRRLRVRSTQLYNSVRFAHCAAAGRWPEKSVKFITRLLKNAESNADAKNIDVEDLYIKSIVVQQAPVRRSGSGISGRFSLRFRKPAAEHTVPTVESTPTRATHAMSRLSSLHPSPRLSAPRTRMLLPTPPSLVSTGGKSPAGASRPRGPHDHFRRCGGSCDSAGTRTRVSVGVSLLLSMYTCSRCYAMRLLWSTRRRQGATYLLVVVVRIEERSRGFRLVQSECAPCLSTPRHPRSSLLLIETDDRCCNG